MTWKGSEVQILYRPPEKLQVSGGLPPLPRDGAVGPRLGRERFGPDVREERVEAIVGAGEQVPMGRERRRDAPVSELRSDLERVGVGVDEP